MDKEDSRYIIFSVLVLAAGLVGAKVANPAGGPLALAMLGAAGLLGLAAVLYCKNELKQKIGWEFLAWYLVILVAAFAIAVFTIYRSSLAKNAFATLAPFVAFMLLIPPLSYVLRDRFVAKKQGEQE
ncbi:Uncharacterised protein [Candidatus Gugararchaeum adminiculabundum]|nr:Uncharacterised protein [Candidatus Gugararchaeum adminiculabundum]